MTYKGSWSRILAQTQVSGSMSHRRSSSRRWRSWPSFGWRGSPKACMPLRPTPSFHVILAQVSILASIVDKGRFHREATITRRPIAGGHKGPPSHSSPLSPLRKVIAFKVDGYWGHLNGLSAHLSFKMRYDFLG